jgi:hypothetical protein
MFEIHHEYEGKLSEHATKAEALIELEETIDAAAEDTMWYGYVTESFDTITVDYPTAYKYCEPMFFIREQKQ